MLVHTCLCIHSPESAPPESPAAGHTSTSASTSLQHPINVKELVVQPPDVITTPGAGAPDKPFVPSPDMPVEPITVPPSPCPDLVGGRFKDIMPKIPTPKNELAKWWERPQGGSMAKREIGDLYIWGSLALVRVGVCVGHSVGCAWPVLLGLLALVF